MHSHIRHLFALLETAKEQEVPHVYIHFFGDGRDTAPRSASKYAQELIDFIEKEKVGKIATVVGRYYAMDRDKRWERVKIAVEGIVKGEGEKREDVVKAIEERYAKDETDEFLKPIIVNGDEGRIKSVFFWSLMLSIYGTLLTKRFVHFQMEIPCSSSTTARIVCVKLLPSSVFPTSPWRWTSPRILSVLHS